MTQLRCLHKKQTRICSANGVIPGHTGVAHSHICSSISLTVVIDRATIAICSVLVGIPLFSLHLVSRLSPPDPLCYQYVIELQLCKLSPEI